MVSPEQLQAQRFAFFSQRKSHLCKAVTILLTELILLCACGHSSEKLGNSPGKENGHERIPWEASVRHKLRLRCGAMTEE